MSEGAGGNPTDPQDFLLHDAAAIKTICDTLRIPTETPGLMAETNAYSVLKVARTDLSQLVTVRLAHQTKRAGKSVKTRSDPQDTISALPPAPTDHKRLRVQISEVLRRAGSGLERDARWRSKTAPGTRSPAEMLGLTGNSANAEVAAKGWVNTVRDFHLSDKGGTVSQNHAGSGNTG